MIQSNAKKLAEQFRVYAKISKRKFDGSVTLDQLYQLESCFDLKISVFTLSQKVLSDVDPSDESELDELQACLIGKSSRTLSSVKNGHMYLDYTNNHLSFITSIDNYARSFACTICNKVFKIRDKCNQHQRKCFQVSETRAIYIGGVYKPTEDLFDQMKELNFQISPDDKYSTFFSVFDFETINKVLDVNDGFNYTIGQKLTLERVLELCSCSIMSSVPGFRIPRFFRRLGTEREFMTEVVGYLSDIATVAEELVREKLQHLFDQIKARLIETKIKTTQLNDSVIAVDYYSNCISRYETLQRRLDCHAKCHVVYSFNGSRFDLKVAKELLIQELLDRKLHIKCTIKRHGGYALLATPTLVFKDMASLLGPGTSLQKFFLLFDLPVTKWSFPYGYITSLSVLDETEFPPYSTFWNSLKNEYLVSTDDYNEIAQWYKTNASCLWDYLEEYNNRDVISMIPGIEKLRQFWKQYDICMISRGISLSSLSARLMFQLVHDDGPFVWLPRKESSFVYKLASESIVGGPALVWKRYAEKGKTTIRNSSLICKSVLGLDAAALYLSCLEKEMPCSYPILWKLENDRFFRQPLIPKWTSIPEIEYCFSVQHITKDPKLRHVYNYKQATFGKERQTKYRPDAYSAKNNKVHHFLGCWHHFCSCPIGQRRAMKEPEKALLKREEDKKMLEYYEKIGLQQEIMTECKWKEMKKVNRQISSFLDHKLGIPLKNRSQLSRSELLSKIECGELFGFARVSIAVPEDKFEKFKEFCPIFLNRMITRDDLSPYALKIAESNDLLRHGRKSLITVMKAERIVLATPLIQWYLKHGLVISDIFEVVQFKPARIFTDFAKNVTYYRKLADKDESKKELGNLHKLTGNAGYGKTLEKKSSFTKVVFTNEQKASCLVNSKYFLDLEELNEDLCEVTLAKMRYTETVPRVIGAMVLGLAKLRLLEMYYDFLDEYFDRSTWELICADTDSLYLAVAAESLEEFETLARPDKQNEYRIARGSYLSTNKETQRQPGLFKLEYWGTGIVSLSPKVYCVWNDENDSKKVSCKGINRREKLEKDKYLEVLHSEKGLELENTGFRYINGRMYQYRQRKIGLLNFFIKRRLNDDGITTEPIIS